MPLGELGSFVLADSLVDLSHEDILLGRTANGQLVGAGLIWAWWKGQVELSD
jgi:hypothetical protein